MWPRSLCCASVGIAMQFALARLLHDPVHSSKAPVRAARKVLKGEMHVVCRLNRAACHLKLEALQACASDCEQVLATLEAAEQAVQEGRHADADGWQRMLVKAHARHATALAKMGACSLSCCIACMCLVTLRLMATISGPKLLPLSDCTSQTTALHKSACTCMRCASRNRTFKCNCTY